ncbi:uncharacterized protein B4U79_11454, partial [Dinothrombium tinctorium]
MNKLFVKILLICFIAFEILSQWLVVAVCCRTTNGICADGKKGTPYCGYGSCNMFGCNCDGGCREGWSVTVYTGEQFTGGKRDFLAGYDDCIDITDGVCNGRLFKSACSGFNNQISSVNTHGNCVRLYEKRGCKGYSVRLTHDE